MTPEEATDLIVFATRPLLRHEVLSIMKRVYAAGCQHDKCEESSQ